MDAKTALKIIKMSPAIMGGDSIISANIKNEVIKALRRQIPYKPIGHIDVKPVQDENGAYVDSKDHIYYTCPMCGECVGTEEGAIYKFCFGCGQAIDGSESEENND